MPAPCPTLLWPQLIAQASDAIALRSLAWPAELHISKTSSVGTVTSVLASKPGCRRLHLKLSYASPDSQVSPSWEV